MPNALWMFASFSSGELLLRTFRAIVTAMNQWKAFQKKVHKVYDFDDIDMKCYVSPESLTDYTPSDIKDVVSPVVSKLTERQ